MAESKQRFSAEANKVYTYADAATLLENIEDLAKMVDHHLSHQVPRLSELDDYYLGNNKTILEGQRRKEEHMSDHRSTHNHARYVSQFIVGYLTGNPITVTHDKDAVQQVLTDINDLNDADALNSELTLDCSVYGRAYELIFRSQADKNRFTLLSPLETFVIYDDTVERLPIAGVRHRIQTHEGDEVQIVELYTENKIFTYHVEGESKDYKLKSEKEHYFGDVPINEYQNNRFRQGDFENVLNLIDLYDAAQSDSANYMTDLNDAMLKIVGNVELDIEEAKAMKDANMILVTPSLDSEGRAGSADADYIYKQYDVAGSEAYKTRIENDIHKFTNTPNLNDEKAGQSSNSPISGEAMKYKLFGLEQVRSIKERFFKRSMMYRYRLVNSISAKAREIDDNTLNDIVIKFTPNLPKSTTETVEMFNSLGGELSEVTKLSLLPFIDDPQEELKRIEEERSKQRPSSNFMEN
ncbi:phage portal protein [Aquibacillus rhizosphaerae]|uniref:Phage portal protein n=1 Tax=Aquibacillus rhizosphaerae TaxID=3051431 RepID=A0ABT7LE52_9BACI|nr:phage portal protein [Aquibacillus sp. LR5S19]MDL4842826.1 phage portal protein [Aquibacillus sp. LR5S19]